MNIYLVVDGKDENLCIAAVYSNRSAAEQDWCKDIKSQLQILEFPADCRLEHYWVFIVYNDNGVIGGYSSKTAAQKKAKECQGYIDYREVLPEMRRRDTIVFYEYWIRLEDLHIEYHDSRRMYAQRFPGEQDKPTATRRRRYQSSMPYRLEIRADSQVTAATIAERLVRLGKEAIEEKFEYNVDTPLELVDSSWEVVA